MGTSGALILLFVVTAVLANLPFLTTRFLAVLRFRSEAKPVLAVLLEWACCLALSGGIAWILERQQGPVQSQHWQFYVTAVCVFLVLGVPGFVWRYLWNPPRKSRT